eukprot:923961_1
MKKAIAKEEQSNEVIAYRKDDDDDGKDDMKIQDDVPRVENGLVMFFGASKYDSEIYPDLDDIIEDEECLSNVFEKKFKYRFISNGDFNKTWSKSEAEDWIELVRDKEMIQDGEVQYDALIFCGASHGSIDAMICSDGKELKLKDIRSSFAVNSQLRNIPKIFIFNCCRTPYQKPRGPAGDTRAVGYSVTITGTEGDAVYGSRLSRVVANAFRASITYETNVHNTLDAARESAKKHKKPMDLRLQEYDTAVGRVVLLKHPQAAQSRGVVSDPLLNTDDDLTNLLRPQKNGSKMDLFYKGYYDALFKKGLKDKASLRALTKMTDEGIKKTLNDVGIKMVFHRNELLKRIKNL